MFYRSAFRYGYGSKKNPEVHEIGGFEWIADESRECPQVDNKSFRCTILTCRPKNENKKTVLWSCLAKGIHVLGNMETNVEVAFHMWQNLFNNGCSTFHVHREQAKYSSAFDASCPVSYGEVQIEIVTSTCADLTDSNNPLIDEDRIGAAHFKVGDEHLWLSKRTLSFNSPFFRTLFECDFKEKKDDFFELKEVDLDHFVAFLGILHYTRDVDKNSVEHLLHLGDMYQCKMVLHQCEEFLRAASKELIPLTTKMFLADRYKLHRTLLEAAEKITIDEWKKFKAKFELSNFAQNLILQKLSLF